jgi:tetratricopeptide (TPR) repeat protein
MFKPSKTIKELRAWMVDIDHLIEELPDSSFKALLEEGVDLELQDLVSHRICDSLEHAKNFRQSSVSMRDLCNPPRDAVYALILEMLITLARIDPKWKQLCEQPRLRILEITTAAIDNEIALRKLEEKERKSSRVCPFCLEFNLSNADSCRFCNSNFLEPPKRSKVSKALKARTDFDPIFLREVVLHIGITEAMLDPKKTKSFRAIFAANNISPKDIANGARQRKYAASEKVEETQPLTAWKKRLYAENLMDSMWVYFLAEDLIDLAKNCASLKRYAEAELVLKYAISFVGNTEQITAACALAMRQCLEELSLLYERMGRYDEARALLKDSVNRRKTTPAGKELKELLALFGSAEDIMAIVREVRLCAKEGNYEEISELYIKALPILESKDGLAKINRYIHFQQFAEPLIEGGKLQQAESILHKGLSLLNEDQESEDHKWLLVEQLTASLHQQGKLKEAEEICQQYMYVCDDRNGPQLKARPGAITQLAYIYVAQKRYKEAESLLRAKLKECTDIRNKSDETWIISSCTVDVAECHLQLAQLFQHKKERDKARQEIQLGLNAVQAGIDSGIIPIHANHLLKLMKKYPPLIKILKYKEGKVILDKQLEIVKHLAEEYLI